MNEFMKTLLSLSLSGTALFLLVLMPKLLYRERFSRRWQYYIWLVVALRFLLPFAPGASFSGYLFDRIGAAADQAASGSSSAARMDAGNRSHTGSDAEESDGVAGTEAGAASPDTEALRDYYPLEFAVTE